MAYDEKFRKRTIEYYESGHKYAETCKVFGISEKTLDNWLKEYRINNNYTYRTSSGRPAKVGEKELEEYLKKNPDSYQHEIAKHFGCATSSITRALKRYGYTRKKRHAPTKNNSKKK